MRNIILSALILGTVACGAYQFPGGPPSPTGTVTGRVIAVPCGPVEPAQHACTGRLVSGLQINFQNGSASASAVTDSNGDYSINLQTGDWKVSLKTYMRIISGPTSVDVTSGSTVVANYILDTGIRLPAPQQ